MGNNEELKKRINVFFVKNHRKVAGNFPSAEEYPEQLKVDITDIKKYWRASAREESFFAACFLSKFTEK